MRWIRQALLFLLLYLIFLAWRFPYQAVVARSLENFERATGSRLTYTTRSANLFGVQLDKVHLESPSGVKIDFGSARLRPGLGTLSAYFTQTGGQAQFNMERDGTMTLRMEKIQLESGSKELGQVKVTGDLNYNLRQRRGGGDLRLEVPKFQAPLPIGADALEIGSKLTYEEKGPGQKIEAEVHMLGGTEFNADGTVILDPQGPQAASRLTGTLQFRTPMKRGTLRLEGTWRKPQFSLVNKNAPVDEGL